MRIAGVNISDQRQIGIGLTGLYGIGRAQAHRILAEVKIDPATKIKELSETQLERIRNQIQSRKIEGDLRSEVQQHIKHYINIHSYRGSRHLKKLPARGQRTKTNARTKRGKRVTVGSGRKPAAQKT